MSLTSGQSLTVRTAPGSGTSIDDTVLVLFDNAGIEVAFSDDSNGLFAEIVGYDVVASGTYTLLVAGYDTTCLGTYALTVDIDPDDMLVVRRHPAAPAKLIPIRDNGPSAKKVDLLLLGDA